MARPIWTGAISFGLVNVPVKLYPAVSPKEVHFHLLHDADGARIQQKRVCTADGEEVPYEHVVKGYELGGGNVVVTKEELERLDPKASQTIDIESFVDAEEIDPLYYQGAYYLVPGKGAGKAYSLLLGAMKKKGKVAIARMVMRTKQYLCTLRPKEGVLALETMLYRDEVVDPSDLEDAPGRLPGPSAKELAMAEQLVESLAGPFKPDQYQDEHREKVLELIKKKAQGKAIPPGAPVKSAKVISLADALKKSLEKKGRRAAPQRSRRRR